MVRIVIPQNPETQHLSVIIQILFQSFVWPTTVQFDLKVLFSFSQIRRILLHLDHSPGVFEWVCWLLLIFLKCAALVLVESSCEVITADNQEHSPIKLNLHANPKIAPVELPLLTGVWCLMPLQEHALRDPRVLHLRLEYVDCVVF